MGGDRNGCPPISINIADFDVAHSAELPTEVGLPEQLACPIGAPELDDSLRAASRQHPFRFISHGLMEHVVVRVLQRPMNPSAVLVGQDSKASWQCLRR